MATTHNGATTKERCHNLPYKLLIMSILSERRLLSYRFILWNQQLLSHNGCPSAVLCIFWIHGLWFRRRRYECAFMVIQSITDKYRRLLHERLFMCSERLHPSRWVNIQPGLRHWIISVSHLDSICLLS